MTSFFGLLGLLLFLVILGNFLRKPMVVTEKKVQEIPLVETYFFGQGPRLTLSAWIEKAGLISIYAQTSGIVQKTNIKEGQHVNRGTTLVSLSTTYQGGNALSLARQIAEKNTAFAIENFDLQLDLIARQRDMAEKGSTQASELREITRKSLGDTRSLISLNQDIIARLDSQIIALESTNVGGVNDSAILGAKQGKSGAIAGLNQLTSTLRTLEYQSDETKIPAGFPNASKELTLRQLDLQERSLILGRDLSRLNLKLSRVSESLMYPAAPSSGIIERVYVRGGQLVNPGTLIATLKADRGEVTAVALVPASIARQVSRTDESIFLIGSKKVGVLPRYISTEATEGSLYSILYTLPALWAKDLTNMSTIDVEIALGASKIVTDELWVPLDSMYQTQDKSYVTIVHKDGDTQKAKTIEVALGDVSGAFVRVLTGLKSSDTIIISRTVQDGDIVRTE